MKLSDYTNILYSFTDKNGGISKDVYSSLNLAYHVGDNFSHVDYNHETLAQRLNYERKRLVYMQQIHSNKVHIVTESDNFQHPPICDALVTDQKNIPLMVMVADCSPILFYDHAKKVIGVAHAGRAGAFENIVKNVMEIFIKKYKSKSEDIIVSIGASIRPCCYEVSEEIYNEASALNMQYAFTLQNAKYYLDVTKILLTQLLACGIHTKNIEISDECTACTTKKHFSYRAEGKTGRFAGVIMLK